MNKIVVLMGKSSSGKDTIYKTLMKDNKFALKKIIMHTTRPIRTGEVNGREYFFCTENEMKHYEEENQMIEKRKYNTIYGPWYYFTLKKEIDLEKNNYLTMNTLVGLDQYKRLYGKDQIISLLIQLEDGIRLERALAREKSQENPHYEELCRRYLADQEDFSLENIKKRNITAIIENNESLDQTMKQVNKVLRLHLR